MKDNFVMIAGFIKARLGRRHCVLPEEIYVYSRDSKRAGRKFIRMSEVAVECQSEKANLETMGSVTVRVGTVRIDVPSAPRHIDVKFLFAILYLQRGRGFPDPS